MSCNPLFSLFKEISKEKTKNNNNGNMYDMANHHKSEAVIINTKNVKYINTKEENQNQIFVSYLFNKLLLLGLKPVFLETMDSPNAL
jgi:hypothetical protein